MAHRLADETLAQVLEVVLHIPDEEFASCVDPSPFATRQYSTSDCLLVSKRWMRVATPLVYSTVILRSIAQARALDRALRKNPQFGVLIRQMRLEGWLGASMPKIFAAATQLRDLCMSILPPSPTGYAASCDALLLIKPKRFILSAFSMGYDRHSTAVKRALSKAVYSWDSIESLWLVPWAVLLLMDPNYDSPMPNLTTFVFTVPSRWYPTELIERLLRRPSTSVIQFSLNKDAEVDSINEAITRGPAAALARKVWFLLPGFSTPISYSQFNAARDQLNTSISLSQPMSNAPLPLQRQIWKIILAMAAPQAWLTFGAHDHHPFTFVCPLFKSVISEIVSDQVSATAVANSDPSSEQFVLSFGSGTPQEPRLEDIVKCTSLSTLRLRSCSPHDLVCLPPGFSAGLVHLTLFLRREFIESRHPATFDFPRLRYLAFEPIVDISAMENNVVWRLPSLLTLKLGHTSSNIPLNMFDEHSFLPQLRQLICLSEPNTSIEQLLTKHGAPLEDVEVRSSHVLHVFASCPRLSILRIEDPVLDFSGYLPTASALFAHPTLATIYLPPLGAAFKKQSEKAPLVAQWSSHLSVFNPSEGRFPSLRTIVCKSQWPTDAKVANSSVEVALAAEMQARGLAWVDPSGVAWRPRMTTKGGKI